MKIMRNDEFSRWIKPLEDATENLPIEDRLMAAEGYLLGTRIRIPDIVYTIEQNLELMRIIRGKKD